MTTANNLSLRPRAFGAPRQLRRPDTFVPPRPEASPITKPTTTTRQRRPSVEVQHERVNKEYDKATKLSRPGGVGALVRRWEPSVMWTRPAIVEEQEYETRHLRMTAEERERLVQDTLALAKLHASVHQTDRRSEQTKGRERLLADQALRQWVAAYPELAAIAGITQPLV